MFCTIGPLIIVARLFLEAYLLGLLVILVGSVGTVPDIKTATLIGRHPVCWTRQLAVTACPVLEERGTLGSQSLVLILAFSGMHSACQWCVPRTVRHQCGAASHARWAWLPLLQPKR